MRPEGGRRRVEDEEETARPSGEQHREAGAAAARVAAEEAQRQRAEGDSAANAVAEDAERQRVEAQATAKEAAAEEEREAPERPRPHRTSPLTSTLSSAEARTDPPRPKPCLGNVCLPTPRVQRRRPLLLSPPPRWGGLDLNSSNRGCARLGGAVAPLLGVVRSLFGLRFAICRSMCQSCPAAVCSHFLGGSAFYVSFFGRDWRGKLLIGAARM